MLVGHGTYDDNIDESARKIIQTDALFVKEKDKLALVVDHEFDDVPSWLEWDVKDKKLSIMQMGGDIAQLNTIMSKEDADEFKDFKSLYLVSNTGKEKIRHTVSMIVKN